MSEIVLCLRCLFAAWPVHAEGQCAIDEGVGDWSGPWPPTRIARAAGGRCGPEGARFARWITRADAPASFTVSGVTAVELDRLARDAEWAPLERAA